MRAAARAFTAWWQAHPAQMGLRMRLAALGEDADGPALIEAARPLIEEIGWAQALSTRLAGALAADPWFEPPLRTLDPAHQRGLVIHNDGALRISLQSVPFETMAARKAATLGARSVGFTGALTLFHVVRAGGCRLDLWEAPSAGAGFAAARAGRCRRAGTLALRDGMVFASDGCRQAWTIAHMAGDLVTIQATARLRDAPLATEYDAASGAFLSASAADGAVARLQLIATLLRLMRRADAAPALAACAAGGPFFLRWYLTRELVALDRAAARPLLEQMAAGDPHAEIRAVAARTLALLAA